VRVLSVVLDLAAGEELYLSEVENNDRRVFRGRCDQTGQAYVSQFANSAESAVYLEECVVLSPQHTTNLNVCRQRERNGKTMKSSRYASLQSHVTDR